MNHIGHAGIHGSNDGQAAGHGFRNRQSKRIFAAWADVEIRGSIKIQNIFARWLKTAAVGNAERTCRFTEKIRGIIPGRDHENWQFSKRTDGAKNGFKTFDAPIVANQEQHEIRFRNLAPQASSGTQREACGRRKLRRVNTVRDDVDILPVKIVIKECGGAL